jgi:hypothetical protein
LPEPTAFGFYEAEFLNESQAMLPDLSIVTVLEKRSLVSEIEIRQTQSQLFRVLVETRFPVEYDFRYSFAGNEMCVCFVLIVNQIVAVRVLVH